MDDDDYAALQWKLSLNPASGVVIPGSGGLRKLRWKIRGRGKRGGYRIIYYWRSKQGEIWLLTMYSKHEAANIPAHVLRKIKEEFADEDT